MAVCTQSIVAFQIASVLCTGGKQAATGVFTKRTRFCCDSFGQVCDGEMLDKTSADLWRLNLWHFIGLKEGSGKDVLPC